MTGLPRSLKPALLLVDSRCEAFSNLERHKQPLELDERKRWLKKALPISRGFLVQVVSRADRPRQTLHLRADNWSQKISV